MAEYDSSKVLNLIASLAMNGVNCTMRYDADNRTYPFIEFSGGISIIALDAIIRHEYGLDEQKDGE